MLKLITFFLFFLFTFYTNAQDIKLNYLPKNKDSLITYINTISKNKITKFGAKYKKDIEEIILDRKNNFIKNIEDSTFIFDENINNYVNSILKEIYYSNAIKNSKDFYFFIEKSNIPNAACYGNGIFTINLGLFNFVNSDDELAYIISHELSHYILEHNDKSLLKYVETFNSKVTKQKIKKIENQEYGKRKAYSEFVNELNFNFLNRSQSAELQADSLGLALFSKTKFNKFSSVSALKNLELSDDLVFNENSKLKEHFNFEAYPFKEGWLQKEESLFDIKDSSNDFSLASDSIKTHPDIPLRVDVLNKLLKEKNSSIEVSKEKLLKIKELVALLSIKSALDDNQLDFALYQTLVLYNKNQLDKTNYCIIVGKIMQKIYQLKNNHNFGKYVNSVSPFSDEKYLNEVRQFLINIEIKTIRKIGLNFCLAHVDNINNPEFKIITEFFKNLNLN
jgi:hypothetical protein